MSSRRPLQLVSRRSFGLLLASFTARAHAQQPGFVLIVHPKHPTPWVSAELVAQAFLKRTTRWPHGEAIRPVDLHADSATRAAFSRSVIKRSVSAVRAYWQQRIFSGRELPPPELASDDEVVRYVLSMTGAIGYVSPATALRDAKVLALR